MQTTYAAEPIGYDYRGLVITESGKVIYRTARNYRDADQAIEIARFEWEARAEVVA